jgi:hypothetical protein
MVESTFLPKQESVFSLKRIMKKTLFVTILFVAAVLSGLFLRFASASPVVVEKETFMQRQVGMPLDMEAVEGAVGVAGYSGTPPLLGSEPKPVSERPYEMANDNELFMFEGNRISADCCPSPFSTGAGCVCLTDAQVKEFSSRGGNRSK